MHACTITTTPKAATYVCLLMTLSAICNQLRKPKAGAASVQGQCKLLYQLLLAVVLWKVKLVEACMGTRQPVSRSIGLVNLELLGPRNALQRLETIQGYLAGARHKLQQQRHVLLVQLRHRLPKPADHRGSRAVASVLCVGPKVPNVNIWQATDEQFQLMVIEDGDEMAGHQLPEALQEGRNLGLDGGGHAVAGNQVDVLTLVGFTHLDVLTPWHQLHNLLAAKEVALSREGEIQHVRDVVLQHPPQVLVVLRVHALNVFICQRQAQHVLVEGACEVSIN
mmetsp:Transcript_33220/g.73453  ORF Transcript_33220/g.73453 Transcript_33220/m.73453 type:complete len:280 (-) Transcript_33220:2968-3807(-)